MRLREAGQHVRHAAEEALLLERRLDLGLVLLKELLRAQRGLLVQHLVFDKFVCHISDLQTFQTLRPNLHSVKMLTLNRLFL